MNTTITIGGAPTYHSYPDDGLKHPGLIVLEEIWGVNDHVRSVADRFAAEGYRVLSPELLPAGVLELLTPEIQKNLFNPEKRNEVQPKLREAMQPIHQPEYADSAVAILKACVDYLLADEGCDGTVAVLGFCFGGSYSFNLAANDTRIRAAVPFYGHPPATELIQNIACPILAFYGENDAALMESLPQLKEDMAKNGKDFEAIVYPGVGHAFFNDTNERAYGAEAAQDAWEKTLTFLRKNLSA
ncbi:dienelactone hydrolase family protein [soil metagenome]